MHTALSYPPAPEHNLPPTQIERLTHIYAQAIDDAVSAASKGEPYLYYKSAERRVESEISSSENPISGDLLRTVRANIFTQMAFSELYKLPRSCAQLASCMSDPLLSGIIIGCADTSNLSGISLRPDIEFEDFIRSFDARDYVTTRHFSSLAAGIIVLRLLGRDSTKWAEVCPDTFLDPKATFCDIGRRTRHKAAKIRAADLVVADRIMQLTTDDLLESLKPFKGCVERTTSGLSDRTSQYLLVKDSLHRFSDAFRQNATDGGLPTLELEGKRALYEVLWEIRKLRSATMRAAGLGGADDLKDSSSEFRLLAQAYRMIGEACEHFAVNQFFDVWQRQDGVIPRPGLAYHSMGMRAWRETENGEDVLKIRFGVKTRTFRQNDQSLDSTRFIPICAHYLLEWRDAAERLLSADGA